MWKYPLIHLICSLLPYITLSKDQSTQKAQDRIYGVLKTSHFPEVAETDPVTLMLMRVRE